MDGPFGAKHHCSNGASEASDSEAGMDLLKIEALAKSNLDCFAVDSIKYGWSEFLGTAQIGCKTILNGQT